MRGLAGFHCSAAFAHDSSEVVGAMGRGIARLGPNNLWTGLSDPVSGMMALDVLTCLSNEVRVKVDRAARPFARNPGAAPGS